MTTNTTEPPQNVPVWSCEDPMPSASALLEYILQGDSSFQATMFVPLSLTCLSFVLLVEMFVFFIKNNIHWKRTGCLVWSVSIYPTLSCLALISIFVPRVLQVIKLSIIFVYTIGMKKFFELGLYYYGGKRNMESALSGKEIVKGNPFPCCFVLCCYRNQPLDMRRIHILEGLVTQVIFVYPIAYLVQILIAAEGALSPGQLGLVFFIFEFILAISSLSCLYGIVILGKNSRKPLQQFNIRAKFACVQLLLVFITLQDVTFDLLNAFNVVPCGFPYPNNQKGLIFHMYLLSVEMFAMTVLAWVSFRKPEAGCKVIPRESTTKKFKNSSNDSSTNTYEVISENVFSVEISSESGNSQAMESSSITYF